jgi:hypothetical protein
MDEPLCAHKGLYFIPSFIHGLWKVFVKLEITNIMDLWNFTVISAEFFAVARVVWKDSDHRFFSVMIFHQNLLTSVNGSSIQYTEQEIMDCICTKQMMEHVIICGSIGLGAVHSLCPSEITNVLVWYPYSYLINLVIILRII